jgi:hypothetical protein
MQQTDVKAATCPASTATTAYTGRVRIKGLSVSATAAATVTVLDNLTTLFVYTATAAGPAYMTIPGEGVLCATSLIVTCSAGATAVAFYG